MARAIVEVEIRILTDGNVQLGKFLGEAGFAALATARYDDSSEFQFLFDTGGGTPALEHNVKVLKERQGIDVSGVAMIVLSHGHWDHVAGVMKGFDMIGKPVPVLCHPDALLHKVFTEKSGEEHEIGIHEYYSESELGKLTEVIATEKSYTIADGIMTTGPVSRTNSFEKLTGVLQKIKTVRDKRESPDSIEDDLSVIFHMKDNSIVLLTGCCHSGIVNTVEHAVNLSETSLLIGIVGGLHLHDASKERLTNTVDHLIQYPLKIVGACHCTGLRGRAALMHAFEGPFKDVGVGSVLKFEST
ncbi:MAG: MBL fold metallo-hydrolase [Candidatus Thorarchaeota archaeon]